MATINPSDIQSMSLEQLKDAAKNYKNIAATGSYGEGGAYGLRDLLSGLKKSVQSGELSILDYQDLAKPVSDAAVKSINSLVSQGKADIATGLSEDMRTQGFFKAAPDNRNEFNLPFSQQEFAKLPSSVLPTQDDVTKGLISRDALPFQRYQNPSGGGIDAQGNPIPADINLGSDRGAIELEAQRQAGQLGQTLEQQKTLREENRKALASQLADYQTQQFNKAVPNLAEQANTAGIYRSTGFGDILANKYADLTKESENQLAMQGLSDTEKYVGGLGDVANVKAGLQTSGLQREFSLDDASRSAELAKYLTQLSQPSSSSGKSTGEKWAQGIQAGASLANAGATAYAGRKQ